MAAMGRVKGTLYILLLYLSSTFGSQFFLIPLLPLMFVNMPLCRHCMDFMLACWKVYAVSLYELVYGVHLTYSGDQTQPPEGAIIVMNHRTRLDWIYLFAYELRFGTLMRGKVILKTSLKHVPGPGWAMQCGMFIFIKRRWETDRLTLTQVTNYCRRLAYKPQILLFPEGTDFTPKTVTRSNKFADLHGLPHYQYVLHPRTTGFTFLLESMATGGILSGVTDLTIGYPDLIPQSELDMLNGNFPAQIHFHIKHHPVNTIPASKHDREEWCKKLWQEKENRLCDFYDSKKQFSDERFTSNRKNIKLLLYVALVLWTLFIFAVIYGIFISSLIRWYVFLTVLVFVVMEMVYGGVDDLQMSLTSEGNANNNNM